MASASSQPPIPAAAVRRYDLFCSSCDRVITKQNSRPAPATADSRVCLACRRCNHAPYRRSPPAAKTHAWKLFAHSKHGSQIGSLFRQLQPLVEADYSIRGQVRSFDCLPLRYSLISCSADKLRLRRFSESILLPLAAHTEDLFREQLALAFPDVFSEVAQQERPYFLNAFKLLWSRPGEGLQDLHYDVAARCLAYQRYSCLLYCTPCYHTAVPNTPADSLRRAFHTGEDLHEKQLATSLEVFRTVRFVSQLVPAGSGILFNTGVAHYGVENRMKHEHRIVVFALFCPRMDKNADLEQRFPMGAKPIEQ